MTPEEKAKEFIQTTSESDGKITHADPNDALEYIRDLIDCLKLSDSETIKIEIVKMTQREFDELPDVDY